MDAVGREKEESRMTPIFLLQHLDGLQCPFLRVHREKRRSWWKQGSSTLRGKDAEEGAPVGIAQ